MALISVQHLTFGYEGSPELIFDDVSFQLDSAWRLGLIGRNGRGKTTLLKILAGELPGGNAVSSPIPMDYFPFPIPDQSMTPVALAEQRVGNDEIWRFDREASLLRIPEDALERPLSTLSGGERAKVLLAMLFARENRFLLIDEPTNHLDMQGREMVSRYLGMKSGFILVSHDRHFLDNCVDHILSINRANMDVQRGNFSSWEENKRRQDQFEINRNERLKGEISALKTAARQANDWANHAENMKIGLRPGGREKSKDARAYYGEKSRRMQQRRKNLEARMEKNIAEKEGLLRNIDQAEDLKLFPLRHPADRIVECKDVSIAYSAKTAVQGLSFTIRNGDILALVGKNGCGKTSIMKMIAGSLSPASGFFHTASGLTLSVVPQDAALSGSLDDFIRESGIDATLFKTILRKLDFSREQFDKDMASYSAGQKKKTLIARSLCQKAHLYLWDEPLNYIDVLSRMQIEQLIIRFRPTMILAEHDRTFIEKIGAKILLLNG